MATYTIQYDYANEARLYTKQYKGDLWYLKGDNDLIASILWDNYIENNYRLGQMLYHWLNLADKQAVQELFIATVKDCLK